MDWKFVLGLGGLTLLAIGVVIFFGRKLNRAVLKHAPEMAMPIYVTPAGTVLWACITSVWLICLLAAILRPNSPLGAFSGSADGVGLVVVGSIAVAAVAAAILDRLGYPIAKRDE